MLTPAAAARVIDDAMPDFGSAEVLLGEASGRVLRQTIQAERDQPPFDRVTMDGIAIRFDAFAAGRRRFRIQGTQHAGDAVLSLADEKHCIEIMTGGVCPVGADCILPVEQLAIENGEASVATDYATEEGRFLHRQGSDYRHGEVVLQAGATISAMDVAVIASCGLDRVRVNRQPVIRVISTGNELVAAGEPIEAHQIRLSNGPALVAMLGMQRFTEAAHEHLLDEPSVLRKQIGAHLAASDVLILSGGVSMGQADFVPAVLEDLGVRCLFHKISQRPGKPMWFGIGPAQQAVFALPGNPVSTLVCARHYVLPALMKASGRNDQVTESAILSEAYSFPPNLTCFLPVRLDQRKGGHALATPVKTNTSGDFSALSGTDGYLELDSGTDAFPSGTVLPLHRWDNP